MTDLEGRQPGPLTDEGRVTISQPREKIKKPEEFDAKATREEETGKILKEISGAVDSKINKLAKRILDSTAISEEVKKLVRESPDSFHEILTDKQVSEVLTDMGEKELREVFLGGESKFSVFAGQKLAKMLQAEGRFEEMEDVIKRAQEMSVRGGQIVQAQKIWSTWLGPEGKLFDIQKQLKKQGKKLTDEQQGILYNEFRKGDDLMKEMNRLRQNAIDTLDKGALKEFENAEKAYNDHQLELSKLIGRYMPRDLADQFISIMTGNLLTIKSLIKNPIYNVFFAPFRVGEKAIAAIADTVFSAIAKKERAIAFGSIIEYAKGFGKGMQDALRAIIKGTPPGMSKLDDQTLAYRGFQPIRGMVSAFTGKDLPVGIKTEKPLLKDRISKFVEFFGFYPETKFRALGFGDMPFKQAEMQMLKSAELSLRGRGVADEAIEEEASRAVFQQESEISNWIQKGIQRVGKIRGIGGLGKFFIRSNIPFVRTPLNVVKTTLEYIVPEISGAQFMYNTFVKKDRKSAMQSLGKMSVGIMTRAAAKNLVDAGIVNTYEYKSAKEQNLEYTGIPPGHVNISGLKRFLLGKDAKYQDDDYTINYYMLGLLGASIDMEAQAKREPEQEGILSVPVDAMKSLFNIANFAVEQSFLKGVNSLLETVSSIQRGEGDYKFNSWFRNWFGAISSVAIPNDFAAFTRVYDNTVRDTKGETVEETAVNVLKSRLFMTKNLPAKVGLLGETVERAKGSPLVYNIFDPFSTQKIDTNPVYKEITKLYEATGENAEVIPAIPKASFNYKKKQIDLNPKQHEAFQRMVGKARLAETLDVIRSREYRASNPEERIKLLRKAYDRGYDAAKEDFLGLLD